jgi:cytochrome bd ubiquinol oxidase subunit I
VAVSAWNFLRGRDLDVFSRSARIALPVTLVATFATATVGHFPGTLMEDQQP